MPAIFNEKTKWALRARLLEIGWEHLLRKGFRALRIEDITQEAGIGKGTFYGFFVSKDEFVAEMVAENRRALREEVDELCERTGGRLGRGELTRWMRSVWHSDKIVFRCLDASEYERLRWALSDDARIGPEMGAEMLRELVGHECDPEGLKVAVALQRVTALTIMSRQELEADVLERTVDALMDATVDALLGRPGASQDEREG